MLDTAPQTSPRLRRRHIPECERRGAAVASASGSGDRLSLLMCLLVAQCSGRPAGAAGRCAPSLDVKEIVIGGGWVASLHAPADSCNCTLMRLEVCQRRGLPLPSTDRGCRLGQPGKGSSWAPLHPDVLSDRYRPAGTDGSTINVTTFFAGWYRSRCCCSKHRCVGAGKPTWIKGLNITSWTVMLSSVQLSGVPHFSLEFVQRDPKAPKGFFLPKLEVEVDGPRPFYHRQEIDVGTENCRYDLEVTGDNNTGLTPGKYNIFIRPKSRFTFNCEGNSDGCPLLCREQLIMPEPQKEALPVTDARPNVWVYTAVGLVAFGIAFVGLLAVGRVRWALRRTGLLIDRQRSPPELPQSQRRRSVESAAAAAPAVTVLLLHRASTDAAISESLRQLEVALSSGGVKVLCGTPLLRQQLRFPALTELLDQEHLRSARILFVATVPDGTATGHRACESAGEGECARSDLSAGRSRSGGGSHSGDVAATSYSMATEMYKSFLRYVMNSRLGQDYSRVFAARLAGAGTAELDGLCTGRLFTVPADIGPLLDHLTAGRPAASNQGHVSPSAAPSPEASTARLEVRWFTRV